MRADEYWAVRPSRRPSVKQVSEWRSLYWDSIDQDWRGRSMSVNVENGYPFPDFYKVVVKWHDENKKNTNKLFYGETAHNQVENFVYDLGFGRVLGMI